jgi:histidine ammonia-lyase
MRSATLVLDGANLTPEDVALIARRGATVELAPEARERNDAARRAVAALRDAREPDRRGRSGDRQRAARRARGRAQRRPDTVHARARLARDRRSDRIGRCRADAHASLAPIAARRAAETLQALRVVVATELGVAVRALRLAGDGPVGAGTRPLFALAAAQLNPDLSDRPLHPDIETARGLIEGWGADRPS